MQWDWCPYKKRKRQQRHACTEKGPREDTAKGGICKPRREASGETEPAAALILDFLASRTVRQCFCLLKPLSL